MLIFRRHRAIASGLILLYHRVTKVTCDPWQLCVSPDRFREQMQVVRDVGSAVPLAYFTHPGERRRPERLLIAVTFDDGYADNLYQALPILEQVGIPATFFLTNPWLGSTAEYWWDELERIFLQPGTLPSTLRLQNDVENCAWSLGERSRYLESDVAQTCHWRAEEEPPTARQRVYIALWKKLYNAIPEQRKDMLHEIREWASVECSERPTHRRLTHDEVKVLSCSPLSDIGAHTLSHAALPALPQAERRREVELSQQVLAELLHRPITSFAYPHGHSCPASVRLVRQAGFLRACTTRRGLVLQSADSFQLPRCGVMDWDAEEFAGRIRSWTAVLKRGDS